MAGVPYMVADINPGPASSRSSLPALFTLPKPQPLVSLESNVYFMANDGAHGWEIWRTNGTEIGTTLLKDIFPNSGNGASRAESQVIEFNDRLFFAGYFLEVGTELWSSDGTAADTSLLKDISPGSPSSYPQEFTIAGDRLFFTADDGAHGLEVWTTDGTDAGTRLVHNALPDSNPPEGPYSFVEFDDRLAFITELPGGGESFWLADATATTAEMVPLTDEMVGEIENATAMSELLFFVGESSLREESVWVIDDFGQGPALLLDGGESRLDPDYCNPELLTTFQAAVYFTCNDRNELWKSDGTIQGTALVKRFNADDEDAIQSITPVGGSLYIAVDDAGPGGADRLYVTDGTANGTLVVRDMGDIRAMYNANGKLFFTADNSSSSYGLELWTSNGTILGTRIVADINPGTGSSTPSDFYYDTGRLYFTADDGVHGRELWVLPTTSSIAGDLNVDGVIDRGDVAVLASNLGKALGVAVEQGDLDGDGRIGLTDVVSMQRLLPAATVSAAASMVVAHQKSDVPVRSNRLEARRRTTVARDSISVASIDQVFAQPSEWHATA